MPSVDIVKHISINRSPRVLQVESIFDLSPAKRSEEKWTVNLPIEDKEWNIGLIVGPSGCGKTTIANRLFKKNIVDEFVWSKSKTIIDDFPADISVKEITKVLSSVGFSSPPSWLRPYHVLSTGEKFRVTIARAMMEFKDLAVIDEFTSVVDRTVAQIGSCAVAKTVRQRKQKLIAVACHYDIIEWMQPDWIYQPALDQFDWRLLRRRPEIKLKIIRAHRSIWEIFRKYHYMNTDLNKSAICFVALWNDKPVAFTAVIFSPHNVKSGWRGHRSVCLPDYQGVGIGNALANFVASLFKATGKPYRSTAAHPAVIRSRARSLDWHMTRKPSRINAQGKTHSINQIKYSTNRMTATFTYVGKAQSRDTAMKFGLMKK